MLEGAIQECSKGRREARIDLARCPRRSGSTLLRNNLTARAVRRTNVIEISYRSKEPKAAEAVVQADRRILPGVHGAEPQDVSAEIVTILERTAAELEEKLISEAPELLAVRSGSAIWACTRKERGPSRRAARRQLERARWSRSSRNACSWKPRWPPSAAAIRDGADLRQHLTDMEPIIGPRR